MKDLKPTPLRVNPPGPDKSGIKFSSSKTDQFPGIGRGKITASGGHRRAKSWYAYNIQYLIAVFFVKISILAFYQRLSHGLGFQLAIKIVAGIIMTFTVSLLFAYVIVLRKTNSLSIRFFMMTPWGKSEKAFECPGDLKRAWTTTYPKECRNNLRLAMERP